MGSSNFDLSAFTKAQEEMVAKNEQSWNDLHNSYYKTTCQREYTQEEVDRIIASSDNAEK